MLSRRTSILAIAASLLPTLTTAAPGPRYRFASIDGGMIELANGRPALVVNTASRCGFTPQYDALQSLHERFGDRLTVLAVPSDDFGGQELASEAEVKAFCDVNFGLTLPMATITRVRGQDAHPFYAWAAEAGVRPRWNFHKILVDGTGRLAGAFPSSTRPDAPPLIAAIERMMASR